MNPEPAPSSESAPLAEAPEASTAEVEAPEVADPAAEHITPDPEPEPELASEPEAAAVPEPGAEPAAAAEPATAAEPAPDPEPEPEPEAAAEPPSVSEQAAPPSEALAAPRAETAEPPAPSPEIGATADAGAAPPVAPGAAAPTGPPSETGKIIGGVITSITADEVELTLDDGRPAVINRRNFDDQNTDPTTVYNVGDRAEGAVLSREDPRKRVTLSRAWALKKRSWERLAAIAESGELLSGTISSVSKKGVIVDVGVRGFVPATHLELEPPKDLKSYVGKTLDFKILEFDLDKERLVLSRRSLLLKDQRKQMHDLMASLTIGETRTGTVSSLADYGAFVDIGGVNGLVHLSELSWSRVRHPKDMVTVGDEVQVKVLDVKVKKRRISLSMRQLAEDPLARLKPGEIVTGPVSRLVDFGAFVDLGGVEGLVHLSEMAEYRVTSPEEIVTPGEEIRTIVLSVDKKRRRIELSIRQAVSHDFG